MKKICKNCSESFETNRRKRIYCGITCANIFRYKISVVTKNCKFCDTEFRVTPDNSKFCSASCYFSSKARKITKSNCKTCNKEFDHPKWNCHKFTYCSNDCKYKRDSNIRYRDKAFENIPNECKVCITGKGRLEVHHIDFDRSNNQIENLCIICHSCHLLMLNTDLKKLDPYKFRKLWQDVHKGKMVFNENMNLSSYI